MDKQALKGRLLVVEDDAIVRKSMAAFLALHGYHVLEAADGREAKQILTENRPDLLLTDLQMPRLDGTGLIQYCREKFPLLPVIIVSGMGTMQDAIELLRSGAFDYITKPIQDMELILHSVERGLEHRQLKKNALNRQAELEHLVRQRTDELLQQNRQLEREMERRQVQEALVLQSKQEWERTIDSIPDMISLMDTDYNIIRMNQAMHDRIGKSYEEIFSRPCYHWMHCGDGPHALCPHTLTLKDGKKHSIEFFEPNLNSYLEVTTVPYHDPDGTLIGSVHIARDVTERKKQQENYERLFESSRDAIVVTSENGFVDCNQAALTMFGYGDKKQFLQLHPADVSPELQPDGTPSDKAADRQIKAALEGGGGFFSWIHKRRDGSCFPAEVLLSPFEHGGRMVLQGVVRDITEKIRAEKEKEKMHSQLLHAQKLESVGQLAAGIAHEINTPTQFIGTNIDFIDEAVTDIIKLITEVGTITAQAPQELRTRLNEALETADWEYLAEELPLAVQQSREGVSRVTSIVRAMKEFSHPGSRSMEPHDLNRIIQTTVTVARNEWKYVAEVELDLDPQLPKIDLLADEMGQVILNMLVNGAHAIAGKLGKNPEGEKGTITISTRTVDDRVELRLKDTGEGIPEEIQARVFDPFYTTKEVGKGTGQGLAIAHDVVEKHHGEISVESIEGKGSEFIISLPLEDKSK